MGGHQLIKNNFGGSINNMKSIVSTFFFTLLLVAISDQKEYKYGQIRKRVPSLNLPDLEKDLDSYLARDLQSPEYIYRIAQNSLRSPTARLSSYSLQNNLREEEPSNRNVKRTSKEWYTRL